MQPREEIASVYSLSSPSARLFVCVYLTSTSSKYAARDEQLDPDAAPSDFPPGAPTGQLSKERCDDRTPSASRAWRRVGAL